jgi:hypothetical protein
MTSSIIETIDNAIAQYGDAMRWTPDVPAAKERERVALAATDLAFSAAYDAANQMRSVGQLTRGPVSVLVILDEEVRWSASSV